MTELLITIIKCLAAILAGIFAGNGAVYVFNHIPAKWLCDYGQEPSPELMDPYTQRVKSYPWKFIFTMFFVVVGIKMVMDDWQYGVAGLCALWLLLEMSMADSKYRIVPDQLILMLAMTGIGFFPFHGRWQECFYGALIGFGVMTVTAVLGKMTYKRDTIGGADMKLMAVLGLILGTTGIIVTLILTTLLSSGHLTYLLASKKIGPKDAVPMVPYIGAAAAVYIVFLWNYQQVFFEIFAV